MKQISAAEAAALRSGSTLIHVLPEEHFTCEHLPGAVNACVYETAFLSRVAALVPDRSSPVIVYGAGGESLDSAVAAEKLIKAGYLQVSEFRGGIPEWREHGFTIEGASTQPAAPMSGTFAVDTETSVVRWTGRNLFNHHRGTLRLSGGELMVESGGLKSARLPST